MVRKTTGMITTEGDEIMIKDLTGVVMIVAMIAEATIGEMTEGVVATTAEMAVTEEVLIVDTAVEGTKEDTEIHLKKEMTGTVTDVRL